MTVGLPVAAMFVDLLPTQKHQDINICDKMKERFCVSFKQHVQEYLATSYPAAADAPPEPPLEAAAATLDVDPARQVVLCFYVAFLCCFPVRFGIYVCFARLMLSLSLAIARSRSLSCVSI